MTYKISDALYAALSSWREKAEADGKEDPEIRYFGLCNYVHGACGLGAKSELLDLFRDKYGINPYPFDSPMDYINDYNKHQNPRRRAWVDSILEEARKERENV